MRVKIVRYNNELPIVAGFRTYADPFMLDAVVPRSLLIFRTHEIAAATLVHVRPAVQEKFHHRRVLVDYSDVKDVLS